MSFANPSVADFKAQFSRDFPFGTDPNVSILDSDITYAFQMTNININSGLFADQGTYSLCYGLLSAHYLVTNIRSSSQGINGQYNFLQQGKGVGAVNENFAIPPMFTDNPLYSMLAKTNYGAQYLQLIYAQLAGQMWVAVGTTLP